MVFSLFTSQVPTYAGTEIDEFLRKRCGIVDSEKVRLEWNKVCLHQKIPGCGNIKFRFECFEIVFKYTAAIAA